MDRVVDISVEQDDGLNSNVGLIEAPGVGFVKANQTIRATSQTRRRRSA
jgi:hypothetical protein